MVSIVDFEDFVYFLFWEKFAKVEDVHAPNTQIRIKIIEFKSFIDLALATFVLLRHLHYNVVKANQIDTFHFFFIWGFAER